MSSHCTDDDSGQWLDLELDQISIPTQSIEEILAEQPYVFDEDVCELDDEDLSLSQWNRSRTYSAIKYELDQPILLNKLENISYQLTCIRNQAKGGFPAALTICSRYIAVGMSRGAVLIFDRESGKLAKYIFSESDDASVAALDFSPNSLCLAIAMSHGRLQIVGCSSSKKKYFNNVIQSGHSVIDLKYINNSVFLVVDSGGSVYEVHERAKIKRNSRCIFAGSRGEVVSICAILSENLVLLASFTHVFALSLKLGQLIYKFSLMTTEVSPPIIDYRHRAIKVISTAVVEDTQICLACEKVVWIHQVQVNFTKDTIFPVLRVIELPEAIINLKWIDDFHLLAMTFNEKFLLIDIQKDAVLVSLSFSDLNLVYNTPHFKALAASARVSAAMTALSEMVCYHSVVRCDSDSSKIFVLGRNGIYIISLLDQIAQLDKFLSRKHFGLALLYISDIYVGLIPDKGLKQSSRSEISTRIPSLVCQYLHYILNGGPEDGQMQTLVEHYKKNFLVLQRVCVTTSNFNLLYNNVYPQVEKDALAKWVFLDLLEEFVEDGRLEQPPASLIQDYLNHLIAEDQLSQFANAVTKFPVDRLDFHQVITICRQNQLFDGIVYVMNYGLNDYIAPFKEVFVNLREFVHKEVYSDSEIGLGNKLLLYVNCCLSGHAYPSGHMPADYLMEVVPLETFKFIVQLHADALPIHMRPQSTRIEENALNFGALEDGEASYLLNSNRTYPNLRLLLKFDAPQFLNTISACADAPIFAKSDSDLKNDRLKRLVDILVGIFEGNEADNNELGVTILSFIVTLVEKGAIPRDAYVFFQLIKLIFTRSFVNSRAQYLAELRAMELLRNVEDIDRQAVLDLCMEKPFIQLCSFILLARKEYVQLLERLIRGPCDEEQLFELIEKLLNSIRYEELVVVKAYLISSIMTLREIDFNKTAKLVMEYFPEYFANTSDISVNILSDCFELVRSEGLRSISQNEELDETLFGIIFKAKITEIFSSSMSSSSSVSDVDDNIFQTSLLFEARNNSPMNEKAAEGTTLKTLEDKEILTDERQMEFDAQLIVFLDYWLPLGARTNFCLNLAMKHNLLRCSTRLLIARGQHDYAFQLLYEKFIEEVDIKKISPKIVLFLELIKAYATDPISKQFLVKLFRLVLEKLVSLPCDSNEAHHLSEDLMKVFKMITDVGPLEGTVELLSELFEHAQLFNFFKLDLTIYELICKLLFLYDSECFSCTTFSLCTKSDQRRTVLDALSHPAYTQALVTSNLCAQCAQPVGASFTANRCGHLSHNKCASRSCKICEKSLMSAERLQPFRAMPRGFFTQHHPSDLSPRPKNVNMFDFVDKQILKLGPSPTCISLVAELIANENKCTDYTYLLDKIDGIEDLSELTIANAPNYDESLKFASENGDATIGQKQ